MVQLILRRGKDYPKENVFDRDACILASRSLACPYGDEAYSNFLNFVEGSQKGLVLFMKCYPDAYREDEKARGVVDRFIENNGKNAYTLHAQALKEYSLKRKDFKDEYDMDMLDAIAMKNHFIKKADECKNAKANVRASGVSQLYIDILDREYKVHIKEADKLEVKLGNMGGKFIESCFKDAQIAYEDSAKKQEKKEALISKSESVLIKKSIGLASKEELEKVDQALSEACIKDSSLVTHFAYVDFNIKSGISGYVDEFLQAYACKNFADVEISDQGKESINMGAELISNYEASPENK